MGRKSAIGNLNGNRYPAGVNRTGNAAGSADSPQRFLARSGIRAQMGPAIATNRNAFAAIPVLLNKRGALSSGLDLPGLEGRATLDANDLRTKAQQCRELMRGAVKAEVGDQLRHWAEDYDTEADAIEQISLPQTEGTTRNERSGSDTEHTARGAACPASKSGSATAYDGPAAANTDSQS
jgi:hypothetical protein